jgi:hypothetical protein
MTHPRINIRIVGNVVLVGTPSSIVHRMYPIGPDAASNFLGDGTDWRNRLADHGVEWPDGSSVAYLPSIGKLVVANTRKNLVRVELALGQTATLSPAADETHAESAELESHAESAEAAEPDHHAEGEPRAEIAESPAGRVPSRPEGGS